MIRVLMAMLCPLVVYAQTAPSLLPEECNGGTITRTERYHGRALAGYMDGGAELYHEYGFVALSMQEVAVGGMEPIIVEVFRMSAPLAAFGIFSVSRQGCAENDTAYMCDAPYQVQGIAGNCYVRIQSGANTPAASAARLGIFRNLVRRLGRTPIVLSPFFRKAHGIILMTGPLGVQNGMPELEEVLEGVEGYAVQASWLRSSGKDDDLVAEITFGSVALAGAFAGQLGVASGGEGVVAIPAHPGWWILRKPGKIVRVLKGSADRTHAMMVLSGPAVHDQ